MTLAKFPEGQITADIEVAKRYVIIEGTRPSFIARTATDQEFFESIQRLAAWAETRAKQPEPVGVRDAVNAAYSEGYAAGRKDVLLDEIPRAEGRLARLRTELTRVKP